MDWRYIKPTLNEDVKRQKSENKNILLLTCSVQQVGGRGTFNAPAIMIGLFFNNENWKFFRIMKDQFPTI